MKHIAKNIGWPLLACTMLSLPVHAADTTPPAEKPAEKADRATELEQRVKALEKKVEELQNALDARGNPPGMPPVSRRGNRVRPGPGQGRDMDQMWEQFRNELEQQFGNDITGPFGRGGPDMGGMPGMDRKPRLGVELAPVSDDLVERYKNPVKTGAFIASIVPGSPAEGAGMMVGDAITSFNGKEIEGPRDLIDAVKAAPKGKIDAVVSRKGETLKMSVTLAAPDEEAAAPDIGTGPDVRTQRWLRRNERPDNTANTRETSKTEVRAGALEMSDELAKELKLTDDQKTKMTDILSKHSKALSDEAASTTVQRRGRNSINLRAGGDMTKLADKHAAEAEKDLAGVLSADQLKQWGEWRKLHNSVFMQHFSSSESGPEAGDDKFGF